MLIIPDSLLATDLKYICKLSKQYCLQISNYTHGKNAKTEVTSDKSNVVRTCTRKSKTILQV
jgi:hypothetical protein